MGPLRCLLAGALALSPLTPSASEKGRSSPWCCELERDGHVASADERVLADRYAGWEPEALAGRLWTLALHRDHVSARHHDAAHAAGRYEIANVSTTAASETLQCIPGAPYRVVRVHESRFEHRTSRPSEVELAHLRSLADERLWLMDALADRRSRWQVDPARLPELPQSQELLLELLSRTPIETVVGWYWVLEATALAHWKRVLDAEFESGDFDVLEVASGGFCGNTHDVELLRFRNVTLADGTEQSRRARARACDVPEVLLLWTGFRWIDSYLWRLREEHARSCYAQGTAPNLDLCFPQPSCECPPGRHPLMGR
jgi:hypothetical protein